jgi:hypothetical protein
LRSRIYDETQTPPIEEVLQKPEEILADLEDERDDTEGREQHARELEAQGKPQFAKLLRQA